MLLSDANKVKGPRVKQVSKFTLLEALGYVKAQHFN